MQAVSIFMLAVAFALAVSFVFSFFLARNKNERVYFRVPSKQAYNLTWGFLFYLLYAMMISPNKLICCFFIFLSLINVFYLIHLYTLDKFLKSYRNFLFDGINKKIVSLEISKQEELDKLLKAKSYSKKKSGKILGISSFDLKLPQIGEVAEQKYNNLKILYDEKKITNPYYLIMLKKAVEGVSKQ